MRTLQLLAEAWRQIRASRIFTTLIALAVAATIGSAQATLGQSAAAYQAMLARLDQSGARTLVVGDRGSTGFINPVTVDATNHLTTITSAQAVTAAADMTNGIIGAGGPRIPVWGIIGDLQGVAQLDSGRWPTHPGEGIIATSQARTIGMVDGIGHLTNTETDQRIAIVGTYTSTSAWPQLDNGAIHPAAPHEQGRELRATLSTIHEADTITGHVIAILDPQQLDDLTVSSPAQTAATARDLGTSLARNGRTQLALILSAGALFIGAVVLTDVLVHRRDLGRRRTLGITRIDLITIVSTRTLTIATIAAAIATLAARWTLHRIHGYWVPWNYTLAIAALTIAAALVAAIPPAIGATRIDPVRVMRTP